LYLVNNYNKHFVGLNLPSTSWSDQSSDLYRFPTKSSKTIDPPGKLEGKVVCSAHSVVSPEIALWVIAILKFLYSRNEGGSGDVFYILHALIFLFIQLFVGFIHL
jgi:hypothetical protein